METNPNSENMSGNTADANNHIAEKFKANSKKHKRKTRFYYSFLTIVLLFCMVQVGFGVILNISKTIAYKSKINTLEQIRKKADKQNKELKQDIKIFSTMTSLEGIARNNLKMAGEDEVLILINEKHEEEAEKSVNFFGKKIKGN